MYLKKVTGINTKMFKKIIFCWLLESHWRKEQDPDLLYSLRIQGSGSVFNPQHKKNNFFSLALSSAEHGGDKHCLFIKQGYKHENYSPFMAEWSILSGMIHYIFSGPVDWGPDTGGEEGAGGKFQQPGKQLEQWDRKLLSFRSVEKVFFI